MNLDSARTTFFLESRENLQRIEESLLTLQENSHDDEFVNSLFREVHTIKGSAGMFGYNEITEFAHDFENLLDSLRKSEISVTQDLIDVSLDSHDHIKTLLENAENNEVPSDELLELGTSITARLKNFMDSGMSDEEASDEDAVSEGSEAAQEDQDNQDEAVAETKDETVVENKYWHISLRFAENVFTAGLDPYSFIYYLKSKGTIVNVHTIFDNIGQFDTFDPEKCYLGFEIDFDAADDIGKNDIMEVFEFLTDDCIIFILPPHSKVEHYLDMIKEMPEGPTRLGDVLVASGTLTPEELKEALDLQNSESDDEEGEKPLLGDIVVQKGLVDESVVKAALEKQKENKAIDEKRKKSLRVDADKIDTLITLVGELVISGANIKQRTEHLDNSELVEAVAQMTRLVDEIRDTSMNVRMVPIGETFATFRRTVHDLAKQMGKDINFEINGGDTELDKTLVEKIADPLMHLVRNAVDHGVEPTDERVVHGKDPKATIRLNAYHESGSIVIEISDDGRGLSKEKIYAKAVERGIISEGALIDDQDLFNCIMEPGFSTATVVTGVSGRGVGMDVVKKNIDSMRGVIDIESGEGKGTIFRIHLPLTLAIIDGFLVTVNEQKYVFPLDMVLECTDANTEMEASNGGHFFTLRGEVLPFLKLHDLFYGTGEEGEGYKKRANEKIVIVEYARKRAGIVVDSLQGEFQTVIKSLGRLFNNLYWISGATILGNGDVALIIDVPRLIETVRSQNNVSLTKSV